MYLVMLGIDMEPLAWVPFEIKFLISCLQEPETVNLLQYPFETSTGTVKHTCQKVSLIETLTRIYQDPNYQKMVCIFVEISKYNFFT